MPKNRKEFGTSQIALVLDLISVFGKCCSQKPY